MYKIANNIETWKDDSGNFGMRLVCPNTKLMFIAKIPLGQGKEPTENEVQMFYRGLCDQLRGVDAEQSAVKTRGYITLQQRIRNYGAMYHYPHLIEPEHRLAVITDPAVRRTLSRVTSTL